jgi:hypothetical protein
MSELLDTSSLEEKAREADAVLSFITRYLEIHHKPPTFRQCCDGARLNEFRVRRAIVRLRKRRLISQSSLRPVQNGKVARWVNTSAEAK